MKFNYVLLDRQMPMVDEIFLYYIIFCRYPDISVAFLSFFSQMRQRRFVSDVDADLFRDRHQHFSARPFIKEIFETAAWQRPATLKVRYDFFFHKQLVMVGPHVYAARFFKKRGVRGISLQQSIRTCNMKRHIPLKRFEYCVLASGTTVDGMKKVSIDFEKRELSLTGDVRLVADRPRKLWRILSNFSKERIEVRATIYPGLNGVLAGFSADEIIFSLEGTMQDSKHINSCSGLLVLENLTNGLEAEGRDWQATLYLYDDENDEREIKLKLTVYSPSANPELN
jgi:hypothetical protein